ncbi:endonuclease/exonuclease/phosphatase family protein [Actinokineospora sp. G85]|uniref:endonuclease/exonuclease/phosphatase family protein n=1 Tax=Actinokineospora sp. G85 TaxID=3406626 RepID=UPI003C774148
MALRQSPTTGEHLPDERPPGRRRRRWVTVLVLLPVLGLGVLAALRLVGIDGNRFTVAALALTPYAGAAGVLWVIFALLVGRRWPAMVALVLSASLGVVITPRVLADDDPLPDGQHVRLMSVNLRLGFADLATVVRLVRDARVDVLVLQELTPAAVTALDQEGLADLLPHRVLRPKPGGAGGGILAAVPLRQIVLNQQPTSFEMPAAVLDLSGRQDIEVMSVHVMPPVGAEENRVQWERELNAMPNPDARGRPRVLAGDFNATLDHGAFNRLLDRGYSDAAESTGEALRPTWQENWVPPITIDHVLYDRRVGAQVTAVYDVPGTDHNAVLTELVLPR